jgi:hypothetical protein
MGWFRREPEAEPELEEEEEDEEEEEEYEEEEEEPAPAPKKPVMVVPQRADNQSFVMLPSQARPFDENRFRDSGRRGDRWGRRNPCLDPSDFFDLFTWPRGRGRGRKSGCF